MTLMTNGSDPAENLREKLAEVEKQAEPVRERVERANEDLASSVTEFRRAREESKTYKLPAAFRERRPSRD